jgi:hypothetical protein
MEEGLITAQMKEARSQDQTLTSAVLGLSSPSPPLSLSVSAMINS